MIALRRRLVGLGALLLVIGIVVGLPLVLLAVGANPLEFSFPSFDALRSALTTPDDGTLAVGLIFVVAWLSWAALTLSLLVEMVAQLRGIRAPRLPGLKFPQSAARGLVGAVALMFVTLPTAAVANAAALSPDIAITQQVEATAGAQEVLALDHVEQAATKQQDVHSTAEASPKHTPRTVQYTVGPGESLWSIAEAELGDGKKFHEIVDLNKELLGGKASFIRPGWVLEIPAGKTASAAGKDAGAAEGKTVTVGKGDTLSSIARDELGDADRYPEIFEASQDLEQPGGRQLTDPDVVDVGWQVAIPGAPKADRTDREVAKKSTQTAQEPQEVAQQAQEAQQPLEAQETQEAPQQAQETQEAPQTAPRTLDTQKQAADASEADAPADVDAEVEPGDEWVARTAYGVGALLAAGVLSLIAARRRTQQRRRQPGQRIPQPDTTVVATEAELHAVADALSIEVVDAALRDLAHTCAAAGTPLPAVRAGRLTQTQFDLYLSEPADLPQPWASTPDRIVWRLDTDHLDPSHLTSDGMPAPYPALVTIGHDDEDGHVFLNLEHLGALAITGEDTRTREILAALALELALSTWADDLQVTLVGAFPELEDTLQTGRIRYVPSIGRMVEDLQARAQHDRQALADGGAADLNAARVAGIAPDAWAPEIVLLAGNATEHQHAQLAEAINGLPRVAMAAVTSTASINEWGLDLTKATAPGYAMLDPIGLELRPQALPAEQYGHLLELAVLTDVEELTGDPVRDPSLAEVESISANNAADVDVPVSAIPDLDAALVIGTISVPDTEQPDTEQPDTEQPDTEQPDTEQPSPPHILVLGPVDIHHTQGKVEPSKRSRLLEYAAYLALNPGASHTAIDDAIWPDRRAEENLNTRNTATSKLRRWVGTTPDGADYLPRHQPGEGYSFHPDVTTDLGRWDALMGEDPVNAPTENLEDALALVRGLPFQGTHRRRYAWAEPTKQRLISEIVDASYELGRRRLMEGRWRAAEQAVVVGLSIEPAQENLWRLRILAAHESRNPDAETEAINRLLTVTEQLECDLEPETEQLLAALKNPGTDFNQLMANAL